jgi:putative oxidoreductase
MRRFNSVLHPVGAGRDVILLLARIGVGIVFVAHGWQKLNTFGMDRTAANFDRMGVPLPTLSAWYAALVELVGGAALILGAFTTLAGVLLAIDMLGAFLIVHLENGVFVTDNGWELVAALGLASLMLVAVGPGRFSVDNAVVRPRTATRSRVPA